MNSKQKMYAFYYTTHDAIEVISLVLAIFVYSLSDLTYGNILGYYKFQEIIR